MLGATQKQLYKMDDSGGITGFQPYKAFGGTYDDQGKMTGYDAGKALAGFSPAQQQAQQGIMGMQVPGQYGAATNMTNQAALGALGTTGQAGMYGSAGALQGLQGSQIGQSLGQMSTDPNAVQSYMNPYIQASLNPQLAEIQRQYDVTGTQQQSGATKSGAFGGSREALMAAENQRNAGLAKNQLIGQGYNQAFQQAQQQMNAANQAALAGNAQAMQGTGIGLQGVGAQQAGYGQLGQAASSLAGIGGQQLAAQQGIYNAQNAVGGQQQQLEQQKINQAIQDYANAQQYPIMQLGTMSNMLRGLPMQAQTTQQYQAQANPITQGIGALGAGASLYNATKAEGGVVKAAKGGIMSYDVGGAVYSDLLEMEPEQLSKYIKEASSPRVKSMAEQILREKTGKASGGIMRFYEGEKVDLGEEYKPGEKVEGSTSYRPTVTLPNKPADPVVSRFHSVLKNEMPAALRAPDYTAAKPPEKQLSSQDAAIAEQLKRDLLTQVPEGRTPAQPISPSSILAASPASPPPAGASPAGASPAAPPRANAPIPANRVNTIVNQNPQLKDAMGDNTPDKNAKATMDFYRGLLKELKVDENKPVDEYAGMSTEQIANKLETAKNKFLGPNPSDAQRRQIMAEKSNAQDDAKRTQAMRMAEFFAMWGSTPGNTIVAGLNAMKNKIPDFITDKKEATKIRRDMDKSIAELDRVDYLEKSGRFDEAGKLRETSRKHGMEWATKMVDLSSRFAIAAGQDVSAEKRTRMTGEYALAGDRLKAAAIRDGNQLKMSADLKTIEGQFAKANTALETARKNFSKELEGDENYRRSLVIVDSANATEKQKIAAREYIKSKKTEADTELGRLKNDVEYYRELRDTYRGTTPGASTSKTPTSKETVNVGGVTYSKPPDMTNDDWAKYKKDVGAR
jgi:soluble cytochrome b562